MFSNETIDNAFNNINGIIYAYFFIILLKFHISSLNLFQMMYFRLRFGLVNTIDTYYIYKFQNRVVLGDFQT